MRPLTIMTLPEGSGQAVPFVPEGGDGSIVLLDYAYTSQRMGQASLTAELRHHLCLDTQWTGREFVEMHDGARLMLMSTPSSRKDNTDRRYIHSLSFVSERETVLGNVYFTDAVSYGTTSADLRMSEMTRVSFFGDLSTFVSRINASMDARGLDSSFRVSVEQGVETEGRFVTFDNVTMFKALQQAFDEWDVPFYFVGSSCVFGWGEYDTLGVDLEYGHMKQLLSTKRENANAKVVTRCSGYGSSDNLPYYYPNSTPKGEVSVVSESTDFTLDEPSLFAARCPLDGEVRFSTINLASTSALGNFPRTGGGTLVNMPSPQTVSGMRWMEPDHAGREQSSSQYASTRTVSLTFDVSRGQDYASEVEYAVVEVKVSGEYTPSGLVRWYQSSIARDSSRWEGFHKSLRYGMVSMRNICTHDQDWDPSQDYTSSGYNGLGFTFKDEVNRGNIVHDFNGVDAEVYTSVHTEIAVSETAKAKEYENKGFRLITRRKSESAGAGYYVAVMSTETSRNYFGRPVKVYIPLRKGETKHITYSFDIVVPFRIGGTNESNVDASVKLSYSATLLSSGSGWWANGGCHDLEWYGVSAPDDYAPLEGDSFSMRVDRKVAFSDTLMPRVFRETVGMERFYPATNSERTVTYPNGTTFTFGPYVVPGSDPEETYEFANEMVDGYPREHIEQFEDIRPTIESVLNAAGQEIGAVDGVYYETGYDPYAPVSEGSDQRLFPYFFVKLRKTDGEYGFNLFDCANEKAEMALVMTSGDCGSATFRVVGLERADGTYMNPVKTNGSGGLDVSGGRVNMATSELDCDETQQDTRNGVWVALLVDSSTYGGDEVEGGVVPGSTPGTKVSEGDTFVITGITFPEAYIRAAERRLEEAIIKFMHENNEEKFTYSIQFSRDWLATNPQVRDRISEHSVLDVVYDGRKVAKLYVESYTYKQGTDALPEISVELGDVIEVRTSGVDQRIEAAKNEVIESTKLNNIKLLMEPYFLRKDQDDSVQGTTTFSEGVKVGSFASGPLGKGGAMTVDASGTASLEVDNLLVRRKAVFTEVEIDRLRHVGGQIAVSCASATISDVTLLSGGDYRCTLDTGNGSVSNDFAVDDLVRCQSFNDGGRFWWRKVTEVGDNWITLSATDFATGSDSPAAGDVAVQFGNSSDSDRQSVQLLSCYGTGAPSYVIYNGIDGYSLSGKEIAGIVFDSSLGEPRAFVYGETHIGDRETDGNQYIKYTKVNGERVLEINGAALADTLSVKDSDGNVVAGMDGSGRYKEGLHDIMFFAGSASGAKADVEKAPFRVCRNGEVFAEGGKVGGFTINKTMGLHKLDKTPTLGDYREVNLGYGDQTCGYANYFDLHRVNSDGDLELSIGNVNLIQGTSNPLVDIFRDGERAGGKDTVPAMSITQQNGLAMAITGNINMLGTFMGFRPNLKVVTGSSYSMTYQDSIVILSTTSAFTLYLTASSGDIPSAGRCYRVVKRNATGSLTVRTRDSRVILKYGFDDATTSAFASGRKAIIDFFYDGTNWHQIVVFN